MQAALDLQSGIMHAQEQDFQTGYSYFYESFEGFQSIDCAVEAVLSLKYMLLCKVMLEKAEDVPSILASKLALQYSTGDESASLNAMKAVAKANLNRSLEEFEKALDDFQAELGADVIIQSHVADMNDTMMEKNLCRIVEPYSSIEIEHVAALIKLPRARVEKKLSQMILDKKLTGILDQGAHAWVGFCFSFREKHEGAADFSPALCPLSRSRSLPFICLPLSLPLFISSSLPLFPSPPSFISLPSCILSAIQLMLTYAVLVPLCDPKVTASLKSTKKKPTTPRMLQQSK